jgi:hypothetical protein
VIPHRRDGKDPRVLVDDVADVLWSVLARVRDEDRSIDLATDK